VQARLKEVPEVCSGCKVHTGFHEAMQEALPAVMKRLEELRRDNPGYTVAVAGHSLGGAVAALMAEEIRRLGVKVDLVCYLLLREPWDAGGCGLCWLIGKHDSIPLVHQESGTKSYRLSFRVQELTFALPTLVSPLPPPLFSPSK